MLLCRWSPRSVPQRMLRGVPERQRNCVRSCKRASIWQRGMRFSLPPTRRLPRRPARWPGQQLRRLRPAQHRQHYWLGSATCAQMSSRLTQRQLTRRQTQPAVLRPQRPWQSPPRAQRQPWLNHCQPASVQRRTLQRRKRRSSAQRQPRRTLPRSGVPHGRSRASPKQRCARHTHNSRSCPARQVAAVCPPPKQGQICGAATTLPSQNWHKPRVQTSCRARFTAACATWRALLLECHRPKLALSTRCCKRCNHFEGLLLTACGMMSSIVCVHEPS